MRLLLLSLGLLFTACEGFPLPEINTLPWEAQQAALRKDARLEEFVEHARPVPAPGLHWHTSSVRVPDQRRRTEVWEQWLYVSGSW